MDGLIGKKVGMTQVWDEAGRFVAVTVLEVGPCPVVQVKRQATDGYEAVQVGYLPQKPQRLTKAVRARFEKAGVQPCRELREFKPDAGESVGVGDLLNVGLFEGVKYVDVTAVSIGRGFAGAVRRFRMAGGPHGHGGHSKRRIGSIGERNLPGWVRKGKPMPGHMGAVKVTARNLAVVQIRSGENVMLVRGAVPGPAGAVVMVKKALRKA
ncbi:MAG: 50S ribosomal protein L3 [Lentisphaerae bacterium]|nr:50S ribosomal protein L3 [Lentisphaerota bacterium]